MWRIIKKAKELSDWLSFAWSILGWLGLATLVTGLGATTIATIGTILKGLPWPIVVAVAWSMFVGTVNLIALPAIFIALSKPRTEPNATSPKAQPIPPPVYEAWRHVEKFIVRDAARLWVGIDPSSGARTTEVDAWIEALCAAIRKGELNFIPTKLSLAFAIPRKEELERAIQNQRAEANGGTTVGRDHLVTFAKAHGYRPKFLFE